MTYIVKRAAKHINKTEWHHLIPDNLKNNKVIKSAIKAGYKFDEKLENLIPLEKFLKKNGNGVHGYAPNYDIQFQQAIQKFEKTHPNYTDKQAKAFIEDIKLQTLKKIDENPNVKLNDLNLNLNVNKY